MAGEEQEEVNIERLLNGGGKSVRNDESIFTVPRSKRKTRKDSRAS